MIASMDNWRDLSALHGLLCSAHEKFPAEERRAAFVNVLKKELGFTTAQAELYTSTVLCQNAEGSADCVMTNGLRVTGSWIRGEQEGNVGGWLSTMKETWKFNDDLTYEHKIRGTTQVYQRVRFPVFVFTAENKSGRWYLGPSRYHT